MEKWGWGGIECVVFWVWFVGCGIRVGKVRIVVCRGIRWDIVGRFWGVNVVEDVVW